MPKGQFVGRDAEMSVLERALAEVRQGTGRIVVVTGEPGIGKTRLLEEFRRRIRRRAIVIFGRGSPLAATIPFAILTEPLESHLRELNGTDGASPWQKRLEMLVRPSSRLAVLSGVRSLLEDLAAVTPLVILLDDVHQADPSTWDLLAYLGRNPPNAGVLVLAALRPAPLEDGELATSVGALVKDSLADAIRLAPLEEDSVRDLAGGFLGPGSGGDLDLLRWLYDRARGNPLFTVALLEDLAADPGRRVVPATAKERARQIAAALPSGVRRTLELAAVLGHSFDLRTIAPLLPDGGGETLDRLVREGLLVEWIEEGTARFDFAHPLLQEAAYEAIGSGRRRELHALAASRSAGVPLAVRAYHVARSALPGDDAAIGLLREAARRAEKEQAYREALVHLRAAVDLVPADHPERVPLLDETVWVAGAATDHRTGIAALAELSERVAEDPVALAAAKMRLASFLSTGAADVAGAERAAREAIDLLRTAGAEDRLAAALNEMAWTRGMGGDFRGQLEGAREAAALAEARGDPQTLLHSVGAVAGVLALLGELDEAESEGRRSLEMARATGDRGQIGWNSASSSLTLLYRGRFPEAAALLDPVVDAAPLEGDIAAPWRTLVDWFLGRWDVGLEDVRLVQAMQPGIPSAHMAWALSMGGAFAAGVGRPAAAESYLGPGDRAYGDGDLYFFSALHRWAAGHVRWLSGDAVRAADLFVRAVAYLRRSGALGLEGILISDEVEALAAAGRLAEAKEEATRAEELADRLGGRFAASQASYSKGVVARAGGSADAAGALMAAAGGYAEAGALYLQARALEHLAGEVGDEAMVSALTGAASLYGGLPAPGPRDRVLATLRATGRGGRRAAQGVGDLTEREREVADLAATGLSTPEIAARLHISERTVESHLAHAYRKLGVSGRRGLSAALARGR